MWLMGDWLMDVAVAPNCWGRLVFELTLPNEHYANTPLINRFEARGIQRNIIRGDDIS
jgi:hypothetical protein